LPKLGIAKDSPEYLAVESLFGRALRHPIESAALKLLDPVEHALARQVTRRDSARSLPLNKQA
jgi:hypothetical protein